jgi:AcrR family transcriptional regulator
MKSSPRTPHRVRGPAARRRATAKRAASPAPRTRRSASEARARILAAAQRELLRVGPEALRLTDLARQLQISHPAILHHFGSREGLVAAVVQHSMSQLTQQLMAAFEVERIDRFELIELVGRVCEDEGLARLLAFLLLQNRARSEQQSEMPLKPLVDVAHEVRQRFGHPASYDDTRFEIQLIATVLLGDAIFGDAVRRATGEPEGRATDFRRRLTEFLPH